jgi:hypothetical protein
MQYKHIKHDTLDNLRAYDEARKHMRAPIIENAGWHMTNIGGLDFIKRKMQSYAHHEYSTPQALEAAEYHYNRNEDYLGRNFIIGVDEQGWPEFLKDNRHLYAHLLK